MAQIFFSDEFIKPFFLNNFGKKYIYKDKFINNYENLMSLNILSEILSNRSYWNNKNFMVNFSYILSLIYKVHLG